jgi:hypothetical protein
MKLRSIAAAAALLGGAALTSAQSAPRETASATVGGKKVSIEYGRPALKGRKVEELLTQLPADRIWRAGVNQVTTLAAEGDVAIGGKRVPAGKYTLYVHAPATGDYALIVNKDQGVPLGKIYAQAPENLKNAPWPHLEDYDKNIGAQELVRVPMKKSEIATSADLFTVAFAPGNNGQVLTLSWGDRAWSVEVTPAK